MQTSAEKTWGAAREHLRSMLSGDTYNLWFAPLRACGQDNHGLVLEVANDFCEVWLNDNYMELLHAVGQHVVGQRRAARVAFVSSEKFTNEYIDGIQNNQLVRFRKKYRQTEVLLIDDIQFLSGKERIQEEFFHTFNALHESHRQIVLTCDRPASVIQGLEHRLVSRFDWWL